MQRRPFLAARVLAGCWAVGLLLPRASGAQEDPYAIMEAAAARFDAIGTLCADFEQTLDVPLLRQSKTGRGHMCQRGGNLFSMRFTEPAGDLVVVDGSNVWVYYPSQDPGQVYRAPAGDLGVGMDFQREFLQDPRGQYRATLEGREALGGSETWKIGLIPEAEAPYSRATVWIGSDDHLLHRVVVEEENGSRRVIALSDIQVDPAVSPDVFTFTPPDGVRIVSR